MLDITDPFIIWVDINPNGKPATIINKVDKYLTIPTLKSKIDPLFPPDKKLLTSINPPPKLINY